MNPIVMGVAFVCGTICFCFAVSAVMDVKLRQLKTAYDLEALAANPPRSQELHEALVRAARLEGKDEIFRWWGQYNGKAPEAK